MFYLYLFLVLNTTNLQPSPTGCVALTTLLLLSDVLSSGLVLLSVLLSLVDVAGFMHFWGLTIDTVSACQVNAIGAVSHLLYYFDISKKIEGFAISIYREWSQSE